MATDIGLEKGRYLLFLDLLGFSDRVESQNPNQIFKLIDEVLQDFTRWENLNKFFRTIHFSDSFILYQEPLGYDNRAFLDVYALGGFLLCSMLSKGIPVRGAISFGDFQVNKDSTNKHQVYFGKALIEAYKATINENWIGITIQPSAWKPYENRNPGLVKIFEREGNWRIRDDGVLLLNPFIKMRGWHEMDLIGEIYAPYMEWDAPDFPNEIRALRFLRQKAEDFASQGDFSGQIAVKYHATIAFFKDVLGEEVYEWAGQICDSSMNKLA